MKIFTVWIIILLSFATAIAQEVVISEYKDVQGSAIGEWTELLVVQDNISLVDYVLRDNAGSSGVPNQWQGGVKFKNVPLWQNLRAGTIIVINHRNSSSNIDDFSKSDGYIEVSAENSLFFTQVTYNPNPNFNWLISALSIAQSSEILQLINPSGSHVHSLSHNADIAGSDYLLLPANKINHSAQLSAGASLSVCPGLSLVAYNSGNGTNQTSVSSQYITKGKPNKSEQFPNENQKYWRSLRQPKWISPSLSAVLTENGVSLNWNQAQDANPSDGTQGYLVVRIPDNQLSEFRHPSDGTIYFPTQMIGSAVVVANINSSTKTSAVDNSTLQCGINYQYRVYPYRFSKDDLGEDADSSNARGRQYNENSGSFAIASIQKSLPPEPEILALDDVKSICKGDSLLLYIANNLSDYLIEWFLFNDLLPEQNQSSIYIKQSGTYYARFTHKVSKCMNLSKGFQVSVIDYPKTKVSTNSQNIVNDTNISKCKGDYVLLKASGADTYEWYKDNIKINNSNEMLIIEDGSYQLIAYNQNLCADTSKIINVNFIEVDFSFEPLSLSFILEDDHTQLIQSVTLFNHSKDTLRINEISDSEKFKVVSHSAPIIIEPKSETQIQIQYTANQAGTFIEEILFLGECSQTKTIEVTGFSESSILKTSIKILHFNPLLSCKDLSSDSSLTLFNISNQSITIQSPVLDFPFSVSGGGFPIEIMPNDSFKLYLRLEKHNIGEYTSESIIPFKVEDSWDSLKIILNGRIVEPEFLISQDFINFDNLHFSEQFTDTLILIENFGEVPIVINSQNELENFKVINLPLEIDAGKSDHLHLRFVTQNAGTYSEELELTIQPCSSTAILELSGTKSNSGISLSSEILDFGQILFYNNTPNPSQSFEIQISDTNYQYTISNVIISDNFSSDIPIGKLLDSANFFEILFLNSKPGIYQEVITIVFEPFKIQKDINVIVEVLSPPIEILSHTIDFGTQAIGTTTIKNILLENKGNTDFYIHSIALLDAPFYNEFSAQGISLPLKVEKNSTQLLPIAYKPNSVGFDTIQIFVTIELIDNCFIDLPFTLIGNAIENEEVNLTISLPNLQVRPGANFNIPLKYEVSYPDSVVSPGQVFIRISHKPEVLKIKNIKVSNNFSDKVNIVSSDFANDGIITVIYEFDLLEIAQSEVLLLLEAIALLGNSRESELKIDSVHWISSPTIKYSTKNGYIFLQDECNLEKRLVEISGEIALRIEGTNIISNVLNYSFNIVSEDNTKLEIYNIYGEKVSSLIDGTLKSGTYFGNYNCEYLPKGMYFLVLSTYHKKEIGKFIVIY